MINRPDLDPDEIMNSQQQKGYIERRGRYGVEFSKVDVYVNLNSDYDGICYSVRSRHQSDYGKVRAHIRDGYMAHVEFVVQEAGWRKSFNTGQKNPHAFARGNLYIVGGAENKLRELRADYGEAIARVQYDLALGAFIDADKGLPIKEAQHVALTQDGAFAAAPEYMAVKNTYGYKHLKNSHNRYK